jgi:hypothetical protein
VQKVEDIQRAFDACVFMWAFDLIELDGDDLRLDPLEARKDALATLVARRADTQARAMAAIAVGEREEWAAPRRVKPINRERAPAFSAALTPGPCLNASKHKGSHSKNLFLRPGTLCNGLRLQGAAA